MDRAVKEVLWRYMPLFISMGVAALVSISIITQVLIPCATGELPFDYCFGESN